MTALGRPGALVQLGGQHAHHDPSCARIIEQAPTSMAGKRDELGVTLVVVDTSFGHGAIII